jgi:hypothetical protein
LPPFAIQETLQEFTGLTALRRIKSKSYDRSQPFSGSKTRAGEEAAMRRNDIMQSDPVTEFVLLASGILVIITLIVAVMVAFSRVASMLP